MKGIRGVVQTVVNGQHGPYAVAVSEEVQGSVTFSLNRSCWHENGPPEKGEIVILSELRRKRAGWRAKKARCVRLSDETKKDRRHDP